MKRGESLNRATTECLEVESAIRFEDRDYDKHALKLRNQFDKMRVMRKVDHWVGLPICFILGLFVTVIRKLSVR